MWEAARLRKLEIFQAIVKVARLPRGFNFRPHVCQGLFRSFCSGTTDFMSLFDLSKTDLAKFSLRDKRRKLGKEWLRDLRSSCRLRKAATKQDSS